MEKSNQLNIEPFEQKLVTCLDCGDKHYETIYYIFRDDEPYCVALSSKYHHDSGHEVRIAATFGTWGEESPMDDHVSFSCRYGFGGDPLKPSEPYATLLQESREDSILGVRLNREAALSHGLLPEYWRIVDLLIEKDDSLEEWVNAGRPS